jgi:hypothetical protein
MPYIIGMLKSNMPALANQPVGDVVYIDVDKGDLYTQNTDPNYVPDILSTLSAGSFDSHHHNNGLDDPKQFDNAADVLYNELNDVCKADKKVIENKGIAGTTSNLISSATALTGVVNANVAKGAKGLLSWVKKGIDEISGGDDIFGGGPLGGGNRIPEEACDRDSFDQTSNTGAATSSSNDDANQSAVVSEDWAFSNPSCETRVVQALTAFYVYILGDPRTYITRNAGTNKMAIDKSMFVQKRIQFGDCDGLAKCMTNFAQTQMFEEFVNQRVGILDGTIPATSKTDLIRISEMLFYNKQKFLPGDIKRVIKEFYAPKSNEVESANEMWRNKTMTLTSNSAFKGNYDLAVDQLVEACREINGPLQAVMNVLWSRLKDSKGLRWKHASLGLAIMTRLLLDGPLTAISEINDGIDKIRDLRKYSGNIGGQGKPIREEATKIWYLLTDLKRLFASRSYRAGLRGSRKKFDAAAMRNDKLAQLARAGFGSRGGFKSLHESVIADGSGGRASLNLRGPCTFPVWAPIEKRRFGGLPMGTVLPSHAEAAAAEAAAWGKSAPSVQQTAPALRGVAQPTPPPLRGVSQPTPASELLDFGTFGASPAPAAAAPASDSFGNFGGDENGWDACGFDEDPFAPATTPSQSSTSDGFGFAEFGAAEAAPVVRRPGNEPAPRVAAPVTPPAAPLAPAPAPHQQGGGGGWDEFSNDPFNVAATPKPPQAPDPFSGDPFSGFSGGGEGGGSFGDSDPFANDGGDPFSGGGDPFATAPSLQAQPLNTFAPPQQQQQQQHYHHHHHHHQQQQPQTQSSISMAISSLTMEDTAQRGGGNRNNSSGNNSNSNSGDPFADLGFM